MLLKDNAQQAVHSMQAKSLWSCVAEASSNGLVLSGTHDQSKHEEIAFVALALYALRYIIVMLALVLYVLQHQAITSCNFLALLQ